VEDGIKMVVSLPPIIGSYPQHLFLIQKGLEEKKRLILKPIYRPVQRPISKLGQKPL